VPGWHEATERLRKDGRIQFVGIIEEQHPDRCALFMQWKKMDWPIMVDSLDLLDVDRVPFEIAVDEYGVVQAVLRSPDEIEPKLINNPNPPQLRPVRAVIEKPDPDALENKARQSNSAEDWRNAGDAIALWGGDDRFARAITAYEGALALDHDDGRAAFRLGVVYRMRYDSALRRPNDFQQAVRYWQQALETNPNQYIWRRRIEQYGPLLAKPYSFYNWVTEARKEIKARGETPAPLQVEPSGTELAGRSRFEANRNAREPDPAGRIERDSGPLIAVEAVAVPASVNAGHSLRLHVIMRPNRDRGGHWNNEVEPPQVWVNPPDGWRVSTVDRATNDVQAAVSEEQRVVEFELMSPENAKAGKFDISGYVLYYVCADADDVCRFRRHDFNVPITVSDGKE
jgi:hypothetical protein